MRLKYSGSPEIFEPDVLDIQMLIGHLPTAKRRIIFATRKREDDARWQPVPSPISPYGWIAPEGIANLGYAENNEEKDIEWLWDLTWEDPMLFTELTGKECPSRQPCSDCHDC